MSHTERVQAQAAAEFGAEPLLVAPDGRVVPLEEGYIPLLTNFTFEDKAAKGLRKRKAGEKPENPVHCSAVELVRDCQFLLLTGPSGSGKTTFAKHLCFRLAVRGSTSPRPLSRNEQGDVHDEQWEATGVNPLYFRIDGPESLRTLVQDTLPVITNIPRQTENSLLILDDVEKLGENGGALIKDVLSVIKETDSIKLLLLGRTDPVKQWVLPSEVQRHDLLPLLEGQRRLVNTGYNARTTVVRSDAGLGTAAASPALFALSVQCQHDGERAEQLVDSWLSKVAPSKDAADALGAYAFDSFTNVSPSHDAASLKPSATSPTVPLLFRTASVQHLLAARHLTTLPIKTATKLFYTYPVKSESILRSLLARLDATGKATELIGDLIRDTAPNPQLGSLLVADFIGDNSELQKQVVNHMLGIIEQGTLPPVQREKAGRILSRLGDPRDLTCLARVPAGEFVFGSEDHPNSSPPTVLNLDTFRIGVYPVVNRDYALFAQDSHRHWNSPHGSDPERRNVPATDVSWHDAVAYCEWLTRRWRLSGNISLDEHVRLPTEPEWERASRGGYTAKDKASPVYPWGTEWQQDAASYEETGFNAPCAVGLFPKGRSPYGCYDMAGQVWEWCSTLWGEDMATPSYRYPWRDDDGREASVAPAEVRRVLRGGCFSSGRTKASCTYRGSLEPAGYWRGNGFRVVVATVSRSIV